MNNLSRANGEVVAAALGAATVEEARVVQDLIEASFGARHKRPVGDRPNNHGLMGSSGSYDLKLIELVTNMQDGVIERLALRKFGSADAVPYMDPHNAAEGLLNPSLVDQYPVRVEFRESNPPTRTTKRLTPVFIDKGCGLRPEQLPATVFQLGGSYKEDRHYLQGAFGMGGAMTYRNADAVVVVSRRDPDLLKPGEEDVVTVAVVEWEKLSKGASAFYLVDAPWTEAGDIANPWSCPADHCKDVEVGTHIALISYRVEGLHRSREGDVKSFDTVVNTRLFKPVMPIRFTNHITGRGRSSNLKGLSRRLADNPSPDRPEGEENLPFNFEGVTYQLPVRYWVFARPDRLGARKTFVAADHVVMFLSNGQVHHHWTPQEFRTKTKTLKKLYDRVLVTVDTDALPIQVRTSLFTADRNSLVRNDPAIRLEDAVLGFLDSWEPLKEENSKIIREALSAASSDSPTLETARRIGRALSIRGFAFGGRDPGTSGNDPGDGGGGGGGGSKKPIELHQDPTRIIGPAIARAELGKTRSISFTVDVVDDFFASGRGRITVRCAHRSIGREDIAVGQARNGRFRISVAVPEGVDLEAADLTVSLEDWFRVSGGLGADLSFTTRLQLVEFIESSGSGTGKPSGGGAGNKGAQQGGTVVLQWVNHETFGDGWTATTVGCVESAPAHEVAASTDEYKDLAELGEALIPVVRLNEGYSPFKQYLASRSRVLTSLDEPRSRYALGVAVDLLLLNQEIEKREARGEVLDSDFISFTHQASARAVLAVMPEFDSMARAAGLDDDE